MQKDLRAEAEGLLSRALCELSPADALREAEVILDLRARAGLAADGEALDHRRLEPFRSGIDGRTQACGTGPIDRNVVFRARRIAEPAELLGDLPHGWPLHACAVGEDADRQPRVIDARQPQFGAGLLIVLQFNPLEGNVASLQVVADGISLGRLSLSVETYDGIVHHTRLGLVDPYFRLWDNFIKIVTLPVA